MFVLSDYRTMEQIQIRGTIMPVAKLRQASQCQVLLVPATPW
jgi:hypothetical protein